MMMGTNIGRTHGTVADAIARARDILLSRLERQSKRGDWVDARCPFPDHRDDKRSFRFHVADGGYMCNVCGSGRITDLVQEVYGISAFDDITPARPAIRHEQGRVPVRVSGRQDVGEVVDTYVYTNAEGEPVIRVLRYSHPTKGKDFRQNGYVHGKWQGNLKGVTKPYPIYRLPDVVKAVSEGRTIWIVEGEKDADRLSAAGACATTSVGGAGQWRSANARWFAGAHIVILADNDVPGQKHAEGVLRNLMDRAQSIRLVRQLPGWGPVKEKHGEDVSDWLNDGHSVQELEEFVATIPDQAIPDNPAYEAPVPDADQVLEAVEQSDGTTEWSLAELLVRHNQNLRYLIGRNQWLYRDHGVFVPDYNGYVARRTHGLADAIRLAAAQARGKELRERLWQAAGSLDRQYTRSQVLKTATNLLHPDGKTVSLCVDDFDRDPHVLNVRNGVLDLRTGMLRAHDDADYFLRQVPFAWDESAECPRWEGFLLEILEGDVDTMTWLQTALGYALTGDTSQQCFFAFTGGGSNGKTTLLEAVRFCIGPYASAINIGALLDDGRSGDRPRPEIVKLPGVRMVTTTEANKGDVIDTSMIKRLTGGDRISAHDKYEKPIEFTPICKIIVLANDLPRVPDRGHAFWRRVHVVEFSKRYGVKPEEVRRGMPPADLRLPGKLRAEATGILRWLVEGAHRFYRQGNLGECPQAVAAAVARYRRGEDHLGRWIETECILRETAFTSSKALWEAFEGSGLDRYEFESQLSTRASEFGLASATRVCRVLGKRARGYTGIEIKAEVDSAR